MMTPRLERYLAPARLRAQIWRLILGGAIVAALSVTGFAAIFGLLWLLLGAERASHIAIEMSRADTPRGVFLLLSGFAGMALGPVAAVRLVHRRRAITLFGPPAQVHRDFLVAAAVVAAINAVALSIWTLIFDVVPNLQFGTWLVLLIPGLAGLALQTGAEELVFRGYLLQQLAARFRSPLVWMGLPGLVFGLAHYDPATNGPNTWLVVGATFLFALLVADLTRITGSIGAAWGFHFANNVMAILVLSLDGTITGLSLWRTPYGAGDGTLLPGLLAMDTAIMLLAWAILRRVLQR